MEAKEQAFYEEGIFTDVSDKRVYHEDLFSMCHGSLADLVRNWATNDKSYQIDNPILVRIYHRAGKVIRYANRLAGKDTDNYSDPRDLEFHKRLLDITEEVENVWGNKRDDLEWRNKILTKVRSETLKYLASTDS